MSMKGVEWFRTLCFPRNPDPVSGSNPELVHHSISTREIDNIVLEEILYLPIFSYATTSINSPFLEKEKGFIANTACQLISTWSL